MSTGRGASEAKQYNRVAIGLGVTAAVLFVALVVISVIAYRVVMLRRPSREWCGPDLKDQVYHLEKAKTGEGEKTHVVWDLDNGALERFGGVPVEEAKGAKEEDVPAVIEVVVHGSHEPLAADFSKTYFGNGKYQHVEYFSATNLVWLGAILSTSVDGEQPRYDIVLNSTKQQRLDVDVSAFRPILKAGELCEVFWATVREWGPGCILSSAKKLSVMEYEVEADTESGKVRATLSGAMVRRGYFKGSIVDVFGQEGWDHKAVVLSIAEAELEEEAPRTMREETEQSSINSPRTRVPRTYRQAYVRRANGIMEYVPMHLLRHNAEADTRV